MSISTFNKTLGAFLLLFGALGFVPGALQAPYLDDPALSVNQFYGRLFGLFPVNVVHSLLSLSVGAWAFAAARSVASTTSFSRNVALLYAVLAVAGLVPGLNTFYGLVPLFSHDVWLSALIAAAAAYFGFRTVDAGLRVSRVGDV